MKKACFVILLALCSLASAQTGFTNGGGTCSQAAINHSVYCTGMQTHDLSGNFSGYVGFWFIVQPDGTFTNGEVFVNGVGGQMVLAASDFAGTFGATVNGVFNGGNGTLTELMGTRKICAGRYGCHTALAVVSGGGSY